MKVKGIQWLVAATVAFTLFIFSLFAVRNFNRTTAATYIIRDDSRQSNSVLMPDTPPTQPPAVSESNTTPVPIDLNTATQAQLETLPGIGPALAQRIIRYREDNGPFSSIGALSQVSGIGEKRLEAIWDLVTVEGE